MEIDHADVGGLVKIDTGKGNDGVGVLDLVMVEGNVKDVSITTGDGIDTSRCRTRRCTAS